MELETGEDDAMVQESSMHMGGSNVNRKHLDVLLAEQVKGGRAQYLWG